MLVLVIVQRAKRLECVDNSPRIEVSIAHRQSLDSGDQCAPLIVVKGVRAHDCRVHQPEPQMMRRFGPHAVEDAWQYSSDGLSFAI